MSPYFVMISIDRKTNKLRLRRNPTRRMFGCQILRWKFSTPKWSSFVWYITGRRIRRVSILTRSILSNLTSNACREEDILGDLPGRGTFCGLGRTCFGSYRAPTGMRKWRPLPSWLWRVRRRQWWTSRDHTSRRSDHRPLTWWPVGDPACEYLGTRRDRHSPASCRPCAGIWPRRSGSCAGNTGSPEWRKKRHQRQKLKLCERKEILHNQVARIGYNFSHPTVEAYSTAI